ncbi:beta-galactosidase, partial [Plakobranchus ocellatus]
MRMKKFQLLCFVTLAVVFFWIIWFNRSAVSTISRDELLVDSPQQNIFLNHDLPGKKPNKDASSKNKSNSVVAILDLPTNLNSVDLRGWEVFGSEEAMLWAGRKETESEDERPTPALTFKDRVFYLNEMPFRIFSGAMHYFRVVPEYWMDRLKKLKACGLNTVETYVPWNLHEPSPGIFDFKGILNLRKFINMAAELGLYVILRPGPYICSEFEFGGLPGWLLADPHMRVRTNYRNYIKYVNKYWSVLLPMMLDLQFTEGGPIIMFQVENEYSSYGVDHNHVKLLLYMMREYGVRELVVTSDNVFQLLKDHPEFDVSKYALNTINGHKIDENHLEFVQKQNQHFPIMVMELWCGWFDWWRHDHTTGNIKTLKKTLTYLLDHGGSFNLYMFLGGTNFGFTSGAANLTRYEVVTTSYDYGAALSEAGDTTPKYFLVRDELLKFYKKLGIPYLPEVPPNLPKASY